MFRRYIFFSPRCFLWGRLAGLGEVDWRLVHVRLLIPCFLLAQVVNGRSKTQAKALWRIKPRVCHCSNPLLFGFAFPLRLKKIFALSLVLILNFSAMFDILISLL